MRMKPYTILIMGLPGSGKTTFSEKLVRKFKQMTTYTIGKMNADEMRSFYNDWDFSYAGRLRQARRMREFSLYSARDIVIIDMVAPTKETREIVGADAIIFIDTIKESRFEDTNKVFDAPDCNEYATRFETFPDEDDAERVVNCVVEEIN
jgi:adenylylsulfate kinase